MSEPRGYQRKTCNFNLDDKIQLEMYILADSLNFSEFVKRCLAQELQRRKSTANQSSISVKLD